MKFFNFSKKEKSAEPSTPVMPTNYRHINYEVMSDTVHQYQTLPELAEGILQTIEKQYMVSHDENIDIPVILNSQTKYIISGKRSFEAAGAYKGKKVAVLNYANNHSIGGAPFSSGAQEESLCRCSTLLPCITAMKDEFYERHIKQYQNGEIDHMGNDDLIYSPDVIVFKTDERTIPVYPQMMKKEDWYHVDVITCAAPELWRNYQKKPENYEEIISSRIKKILDVAAKENVQVLILGAWGCGAFRNPLEVVGRQFRKLLRNYNFETVEFALARTETTVDDTLLQTEPWKYFN